MAATTNVPRTLKSFLNQRATQRLNVFTMNFDKFLYRDRLAKSCKELIGTLKTSLEDILKGHDDTDFDERTRKGLNALNKHCERIETALFEHESFLEKKRARTRDVGDRMPELEWHSGMDLATSLEIWYDLLP